MRFTIPIQSARAVAFAVTFVSVLATMAPCLAEDKLAKSNAAQRYEVRKVTRLDRETAEQHPLWPALQQAVDSYRNIRRNIRDYSCKVVRRERVRGVLQPPELMTAKVRHQRSRNGKVEIPFGVYLKVHAPDKVKGREVLFVDGQNDGRMLVRNGGKRFGFVTTRIAPESDTAMATNRYPITEFGIENLVRRLIQVVKEDMAISNDTQVDFYPEANIDGRTCTAIKVVHPTYDQRLRFHMATVFVDKELQVPVHYEAYDWPQEKGGEPILLEQYTYRDIKLNVGYSDYDFSPDNESYGVK